MLSSGRGVGDALSIGEKKFDSFCPKALKFVKI